MHQVLTLAILAQTFAISRLDSGVSIPDWILPCDWWSITRTGDELSIVCPEVQVPAEVISNRGWRCLKVAGPLDLASTGILASLLEPLARARISVFSVSTFDTDYLLVKAQTLGATVRVLSLAGHQILDS
ncbi:MAG TPA: ACT domain-containing protein [Terriglobia bacterium]|jgi:hypothetical protein|nr:ACT domain-containing protein [Terriglobia bacterium]